MNEFSGDMSQFRNPLSDEDSLRVVLFGLLYGIVYADGIDARHSGLHLKLRVVNAGFVV